MRLKPGLECEIEEGAWKLTAGMSGTGDMLRHVMEQAGLVAVEVTRLSTTLRYPSDDEACGAAFAGGPVALAYSRFDATTRDDAHGEYLKSLEPWRTAAGYEVPGEFVVAGGITR